MASDGSDGRRSAFLWTDRPKLDAVSPRRLRLKRIPRRRMQQSRHDPILAPVGKAAADDFVGRLYGAWVVAAVDAIGRRATVVCKCGETRQVAIEALTAGESVSCGCRLTRHRPGW